MTVILDLSQISFNWTLMVLCGCKSSLWLRRVRNTATLLQVTKKHWLTSVYLFAKHLRLWYILTRMDVWHVTHQLKFSPVTPGFYILVLAQMDFFHTEVLLFHKPPVSPIMGASDKSQVSTVKSSIYFKYVYFT